MQAHAGDAGVFIRSMATRGHLGGLARATSEVALVLDAAGKDVVLIETVGVGQDEVDIVRTADISIVMTVPGSGDEVQALKAGIMEIADIFVVNKADREGADRAVASIEALLSLQTFAAGEWRPPILKTEATGGKGVPELLEAIDRFRAHSVDSQGTRRRARAEWRLRELLAQRLLQHVERQCSAPANSSGSLNRIAAREVDPYSAADEISPRPSANLLNLLNRLNPVNLSSSTTSGSPCRALMRPSRSIATPGAGDRSARRGRVTARAGAFHPGRRRRARAARGDRRRFADREVHCEAGPGPPSHHARGARHSRARSPGSRRKASG